MSNIREILGTNIKFFRRSKGITQETLAEMVEVSGSYIGYLERGKKSPSLDLLAKIADILQVAPATLLTPSDDEADGELKKLIAMLTGRETAEVKFVTEVAAAYFRSLEGNKRKS